MYIAYWEKRHRPIIYNIFFTFSGTGIKLAFFHRLGNTVWLTEFTKSIFEDSTIVSSQSLSILIDMPSLPWALFKYKDLIVFRISLPEIVVESKEEAVRYDLLGSTEPLTTGKHCKLRNSVKLLAFYHYKKISKRLVIS